MALKKFLTFAPKWNKSINSYTILECAIFFSELVQNYGIFNISFCHCSCVCVLCVSSK